MSKLKSRTKRLYNFHRDNKWDIFKALVTNYIYACFMIGVPVAIFIGNVWLVFLALLGAYTMLTVVINRPRYETLYGQVLMVIACTSGGMTSYLLGEWIKTLI